MCAKVGRDAVALWFVSYSVLVIVVLLGIEGS
jgi:hypothetical protein